MKTPVCHIQVSEWLFVGSLQDPVLNEAIGNHRFLTTESLRLRAKGFRTAIDPHPRRPGHFALFRTENKGK